MKILYNTYPVAFHTPGGGEVQLDNYYKYVNLIDGINVSKFDQWKPDFDSFDLVHFFSLMGGSIPFCSFVKQIGKPLAVTTSLWINEKNVMHYPMNEIRDQLHCADKIIVNSDLESENIRSYIELDSSKFTTVYNAVSNNFFRCVPGELFRKTYNIHDQFILCVANIEERKNQILLAKAVKRFPNYKLVLIGHVRQPFYYNELLKIANDQLIYLGPVQSNSEILVSAYHACDLFVLPSLLETPGLATLEAAAAGAQIVVTEIGSAKEYFGDNVTYCNPYSIDSLCDAIDTELAFKRNCSEHIKSKFTWEIQTSILVNAYREMLGESN